MKCLNCPNQITSKDKRGKFCSMTCSASYNNKLYPKRKRSKKCKAINCDNMIYSGVSYCKSCQEKDIHLRGTKVTDSRTIASLIRGSGSDASRYSQIRYYARLKTSKREQTCEYCGYSKHVECCHVKDIASFPLTATLGEVNAEDNLSLLCRNHHWEFDHGFLVKIEGKWTECTFLESNQLQGSHLERPFIKRLPKPSGQRALISMIRKENSEQNNDYN